MFYRLPAAGLQLPFPAQSPRPSTPDSAPNFPLSPGPQTHRQHPCHINTVIYINSVKKNASACVIMPPVGVYHMSPGSRTHFKQETSEKSLFFYRWEVSFIITPVLSWLMFYYFKKKYWIILKNMIKIIFLSYRWRSADGDDQICESCSSSGKSNHKRALKSETKHRLKGECF